MRGFSRGITTDTSGLMVLMKRYLYSLVRESCRSISISSPFPASHRVGMGKRPARDDSRFREDHDHGCVVLAILGKQGFCPYVGSGSGYHLLSLVSISPVGCSCWCYPT